MRKFSVVMPLYNKETSVRGSVESVLSQMGAEVELIIVDDGSTDRSVECLQDYVGDRRVRLLSQRNSGVSVARNVGISHASYGYIAFIDADDVWMPGYLETISRMIESFPDAGLYATAYVRDSGYRTAELNLAPSLQHCCPAIVENYFHAATLGEQPFFTSSTCVRRDVFSALDGFRIGVAHGEDLDMWSRIAYNYTIVYHREPRVVYRTAAENRAMQRYPELTPWIFRDFIQTIGKKDSFHDNLKSDMEEYAAKIDLYTVTSNFLRPQADEVLDFLSRINTDKFQLKKKALKIALHWPRPVRLVLKSFLAFRG